MPELPAHIAANPNRLLTRAEVRALCGWPSDVTLWRWMRAGQFPRSVKIGRHKVAWRQSNILAWLDSRQPYSAT